MKRYAIRFPDGTYSKGSKNQRTARVPFEKAKLWTNVGHIKNHLNGLGSDVKNYPPGTEIVEVVITHTETVMMTVQDALAESRLRDQQRRAKNNLHWARIQLEEAERKAARNPLDPVSKAQRELEEAIAKAEALGVET